jgi:uncharacterized protein YabN with tetrapyrrole methylase and pyrophosphatase domain
MIRLLAVLVVIIVVAYANGPTEESLTPCVSSRIATHSDDPTYAALSEQHNRSIDVDSELQTLNDLQQYPNIIALAQTRRAELEDAILNVQGMPLVAQQRDRVLTAMREQQDEMLRVIVAASESR